MLRWSVSWLVAVGIVARVVVVCLRLPVEGGVLGLERVVPGFVGCRVRGGAALAVSSSYGRRFRWVGWPVWFVVKFTGRSRELVGLPLWGKQLLVTLVACLAVLDLIGLAVLLRLDLV